MRTKIEWTRGDDGTAGETWDPLAGCSEVSPGCANCYAAQMARRLEAMGQEKYAGTTRQAPSGKTIWTGKINLDEKALKAPLGWKKPRRVFVNSMSDLFHEDVPVEFIDKVFRVMFEAKQHTFQVLTKRAAWMKEYTTSRWGVFGGKEYPLSRNIWLGVSVEDQQRADERIPLLLQTPAAIRFLSCEPLLGPVDLSRLPAPEAVQRSPNGGLCYDALKSNGERYFNPPSRIDWVIVGSESGRGARSCDLKWVRSIRNQCVSADVPFFWKQHVEGGKKISLPLLDGRQWNEFPLPREAAS